MRWNNLGDAIDRDGDPDTPVTLVFKKEKGIAHTSGAKITISTEWIGKHPDDFGMVIHELCHVVQSYPKGVGWITEGIADYIRYFKYEPRPTPPKVGAKASYKDGYKTSATFLAWTLAAATGAVPVSDTVSRMAEVLVVGAFMAAVGVRTSLACNTATRAMVLKPMR